MPPARRRAPRLFVVLIALLLVALGGLLILDVTVRSGSPGAPGIFEPSGDSEVPDAP